MVGIVVVSHSAALAEGVVELARQMGGEELRIEAAGGMEDGSIGTDAARVLDAIQRAMSDDGVLVLMDLGSALMSAEMAVEMLGTDRVQLSEAPLVEGAVAAAASARGGASLEEVLTEARGALGMKAAQLGVPGVGSQVSEPEPVAEPEASVRVPVLNEIGLHARPAALVVELAGRFDAALRLAKPGGASVSARSLTGLMTLSARMGDELIATASGPQADEALKAFEELAAEGFGEGVTAPAPATPPVVRAPSTEDRAPQPGSTLHGIAASPGLAIAPARPLAPPLGPPPEREAEAPEAELRKLDEARALARTAIEADRASVAERTGPAEAAIFAAHLALLDDEALLERARADIAGGATAETAWYDASERAAAAARALDDPLLQARAIDIEDTGQRVVAALTGREAQAGPTEEGIVIAAELTPADAAALDPDLVRGIATAHGTATAHAAILARALGLPAVVGLGEVMLAVPEGTPLLLDGGAGEIVVAPPDEVVSEAREQAERAAARRAAALERAHEPAATADGTRIEVAANLGGAGGAAAAVELGAEGVGLLRTEFLFLDRPELPSEDEQVETLSQIARELEGRPLIVRTLDVGADKPLPAVPMEPEENPFLGLRGIRLGLQAPELLATQLRAILRAAVEHPLKVMFPMVATLAEVEAALGALAHAREETGVDAPLETGIMVEVPSAALRAGQLAERLDFFSIGTNDLTQYTMAAERGNEHVAELLGGPQPAVLRLVRETVAGAEAHGRWVGVCGELAGDPAAAVLLAGLGVRELSMAPPLIPEVKEALRAITLADAREAAERALDATDADEARKLALEALGGRW
jgi:multiphosphoryl transfer protein